MMKQTLQAAVFNRINTVLNCTYS